MEHSAGLWWLTGRVTLFEAGVLTAVAAVARAVPVAARSGARRRGRWRQRRDDLLPPEVDCGHSIIDHFASYCTARRFCRRSHKRTTAVHSLVIRNTFRVQITTAGHNCLGPCRLLHTTQSALQITTHPPCRLLAWSGPHAHTRCTRLAWEPTPAQAHCHRP